MAGKQANGGAAGLDWRAMAQPVKAPEPVSAALISGGHNLVIDQRTPGALSLHIATDEQAMAEIFQAQPSKEKAKSDPNAIGARYLSRTTGPMYGSVPLSIGGRRFFLKMTLEEERAKA